MSDNLIYIPKLCPLRFVRLDTPVASGKNFIHFDEDWIEKQIKPYDTHVNYLQKWQQADTIKLQIKATYGPVKVDIIDCSQKVIKSVQLEPVVTAVVGQLWKCYEGNIQLADIAEGAYYAVLSVGSGEFVQKFISEPIELKLKHENTMLFEYSHSYNNYGVLFETGYKPSFRCEAAITDFLPGADETVYTDQIYDTTLLSSTPFRNFKLTLGEPYGVSDWVVDLINRIYSCDTVLADRKQYARPDGTKMEKAERQGYPLLIWQMDLRESQNDYEQNYDADFDAHMMVTYNIQVDAFGAFNDQAQNNTVQIIKVG